LIDSSIEGKVKQTAVLASTILPSMVATIEILAGKRSELDYFLQPFVKGRDAAFRE